MLLLHDAHRDGITPAHAGKRLSYLSSPSFSGDHPRTRGEKYRFYNTSCLQWGSPPHTRGKVHMIIFLEDCPGITPAHAGKSSYDDGMIEELRDHPRTRGEKQIVSLPTPPAPGSPPHTRGKVRQSRQQGNVSGITPAHAGKR